MTAPLRPHWHPLATRRRAAIVVGCLLLVSCSSNKGRAVLDLATDGPGTCLNVPEKLGETVSALPKVDCATAHTHEIYSVVKYVASVPTANSGVPATVATDVFPGLQALDGFAERVCVRDFEPFVGTSNFDSTLTFTWLTPTLTSWNDHKDRDILCVLSDIKSATLTGTMKNSHR